MNKLFDGFVGNIKEIIGCEFGVADSSGAILACTDAILSREAGPVIDSFLDSEDLWMQESGMTLYKTVVRDRPQFVLFVLGGGEAAEKYLELAAISISNIKLYYDEKYDKNSFIKQIILDNILPGDISIRAKELNIA